MVPNGGCPFTGGSTQWGPFNEAPYNEGCPSITGDSPQREYPHKAGNVPAPESPLRARTSSAHMCLGSPLLSRPVPSPPPPGPHAHPALSCSFSTSSSSSSHFLCTTRAACRGGERLSPVLPVRAEPPAEPVAMRRGRHRAAAAGECGAGGMRVPQEPRCSSGMRGHRGGGTPSQRRAPLAASSAGENLQRWGRDPCTPSSGSSSSPWERKNGLQALDRGILPIYGHFRSCG